MATNMNLFDIKTHICPNMSSVNMKVSKTDFASYLFFLRFDVFSFERKQKRVPFSSFSSGSEQPHTINQTPLIWPNKLSWLFYLAAQLLRDINPPFDFWIIKETKKHPRNVNFFRCKSIKGETTVRLRQQLCYN